MPTAGTPVDWNLVMQQVDASVAAAVLAAFAWPLLRALRITVADARDAGRPGLVFLGLSLALALALRTLLARPTLLFALPDVYHFLDKVQDPWGAAGAWHSIHGMLAPMAFHLAGRLLGFHLPVIWAVNIVAGVLSCAVLHALVARWTGRPWAGLLAAFLLAVHVPSIRIDTSEQLASVTILVSLVALTSAWDLARHGTRRDVLATGLSLGALAHVRPEAAFVTGVTMLAALLILQRDLPDRRRAWGRLAAAVGLAAFLWIPRAPVLAREFLGRDLDGARVFSLEALPGLFLGDRNIFFSVGWPLPVPAVLFALGLAVVLLRRQWRLALFLAVALGLPGLQYCNGWTLDRNDAFRFQHSGWFVMLAVGALGAEAVLASLRSRAVRGVAAAALLALAALPVVLERPLLSLPQPADRSVRFLEQHLDEVPAGCQLLLPMPEAQGGDDYDAGALPRWLLKDRPALRIPGGRVPPPAVAGACRVAFLGFDCYLHFPRGAQGWDPARPIHEGLATWREGMDRQPPPPGPRPHCQAVGQDHDLQPLVTEVLQPGRAIWAWTPTVPVEIGLYRVVERSRPVPAVPAPGPGAGAPPAPLD